MNKSFIFLKLAFTYVNLYVNIKTNEIRRWMRKEEGFKINEHKIYKEF